MKSKIIIISIVILSLVAAYFLYTRTVDEDGELEALDFGESSFLNANLYSSDLGQADLPEIELGEEFDFNFSGIEIGEMEESEISYPEISTEDINFNISSPNIGITMPQTSPGDTEETQEEPPETWTPNASDCARFSTAPSCSYVPAENREMCEACEAAGF